MLARGLANKSDLSLEQAVVTAVAGNVATLTLRGGTVAGVECLAPPTVGARIWVLLDRARLLGLVPGTGGGGSSTSVEEVWVSAVQPPSPVELWVDTAASAAGAEGYVHTQATASKDWVVVHGLGRMPAVQAFDAAASMIVGSVHQDTPDQLTIHFAVAITGKAYCT